MVAPKGEFRRMLGRRKPALTVGVWDCLSAKLVEKAGYDWLEVGSYQVAASEIGKLDIGLYTMSEMVEVTRNIAATTGIPVNVDAEQGHGNAIHVIRTIQELENAGAQGVMMDDKVMETCPWLPDPAISERYWRGVISKDEMVGKVKAAAQARASRDFIVMFRSNSRGPGWKGPIEPALERSRLAVKAGADVIRVLLKDLEEIALWDKLEVPLSVSIGGKLLGMKFSEIAALSPNIKLINIGSDGIRCLAKGYLDALVRVREQQSDSPITQNAVSHDYWVELFGGEALAEQIKNFIPKVPASVTSD